MLTARGQACQHMPASVCRCSYRQTQQQQQSGHVNGIQYASTELLYCKLVTTRADAVVGQSLCGGNTDDTHALFAKQHATRAQQAHSSSSSSVPSGVNSSSALHLQAYVLQGEK
jgi:hypothetical protein